MQPNKNTNRRGEKNRRAARKKTRNRRKIKIAGNRLPITGSKCKSRKPMVKSTQIRDELSTYEVKHIA